MGGGKKKDKKKSGKKNKIKKEEEDDELVCPNTLASGGVKQKHFSFNLEVDFTRKRFRGFVAIEFKVTQNNVASFTLDTSSLLIASVRIEDELVRFQLKKEEAPFGRALEIFLNKPLSRGQSLVVTIEYETSPSASGIQWLDPSLTEGKRHPYVFTQFQAILARSFVPCQDTPGRKATYDATVTVPSPLTCLMSAVGTGKREVQNGHATEFYFVQRVPIPTYLLAIVVGNVAGRAIGPISTVWCEPERLEAAAWEFAQVDDFIRIADSITDYPYRKLGWGKYDLLCLPGSFPYGGMENPCLTFVTPTLLCGDRSMTGTVIHELAHSWFGNCLTNSTWESFWLNEGFTVWLERKIIGRIEGSNRRDMEIVLHDASLKSSLQQMSGTPAAISLVMDLSCTDPDDFYSSIPYEKGSQLLYWLEKEVVRDEASFEKCIQAWIKKNVFGTVTSEQFREFFEEYYANDGEVFPRLSRVPWHAWFYDRDPKGCPVDVLSHCDTTLVDQARDLAKRWLESDGKGCQASDMDSWTVHSKILFLQEIEGLKSLDVLKRLDELYKFSSLRNAELRFLWLVLAIKLNHKPAFEDAEAMLREQGRMKFTRPLYRAIASQDRELAIRIFRSSSYHPVCQRLVAKDLGL